ncbi:hypothetical protein EVAR_35376_1, partial [Eumeta japonica]
REGNVRKAIHFGGSLGGRAVRPVVDDGSAGRPCTADKKPTRKISCHP